MREKGKAEIIRSGHSELQEDVVGKHRLSGAEPSDRDGRDRFP